MCAITPRPRISSRKFRSILTVQGDSGHVYHGTIESFDNRINTGSGTIRARARFDNEDGALVPGMFVSVRMGGGTLNNALAGAGKRHRQRPEQALCLCRRRRTTRRNIAKSRWAPTVDGKRVVTTGLKAGDRVILDGLQQLAPGAPVDAEAAAADRQQLTQATPGRPGEEPT